MAPRLPGSSAIDRRFEPPGNARGIRYEVPLAGSVTGVALAGASVSCAETTYRLQRRRRGNRASAPTVKAKITAGVASWRGYRQSRRNIVPPALINHHTASPIDIFARYRYHFDWYREHMTLFPEPSSSVTHRDQTELTHH
jgi:hypothetical protein